MSLIELAFDILGILLDQGDDRVREGTSIVLNNDATYVLPLE